MLDLPEVPPGPVAWEDFMNLILEAIEARTPIQTENCDVNETTTGFEIIPFAGGAPQAFVGTYKLYTVTASPTTGCAETIEGAAAACTTGHFRTCARTTSTHDHG